jgi:hypothetical protein
VEVGVPATGLLIDIGSEAAGLLGDIGAEVTALLGVIGTEAAGLASAVFLADFAGDLNEPRGERAISVPVLIGGSIGGVGKHGES